MAGLIKPIKVILLMLTVMETVVVDYAILREEYYKLIDKLRVGELCEFSDHRPI